MLPIRRTPLLCAGSVLLLALTTHCVRELHRQPSRATDVVPVAQASRTAEDELLRAFDPDTPHRQERSGHALVLPRRGEELTDATRQAEEASVVRVLDAFRWEAMPFLGLPTRMATLVVLDPNLVSEESGLPTPGVCYNTTHTVVLNRDLWQRYSEDEREVVLYHELGHCELGRRHTAGRRLTGGPISLMNPNSVADVGYVLADRAYYLNELFTTRQTPPHVRFGRPTAASRWFEKKNAAELALPY